MGDKLLLLIFDKKYFLLFISFIFFSINNFFSFNLRIISTRYDDSIPLFEFSTINSLYIFIWVSMLLLSKSKVFNFSFFSSFGSILFKLLYFYIISLSYRDLMLSFKSFKSSLSFENEVDKIIPM